MPPRPIRSRRIPPPRNSSTGPRLSFLAGAAVGYVLGTRAGQERYREIVEGVRGLGDRPAFQQAQAKVRNLLNRGADTTGPRPSDAAYRSATGGPTASEPGTVGAKRSPA